MVTISGTIVGDLPPAKTYTKLVPTSNVVANNVDDDGARVFILEWYKNTGSGANAGSYSVSFGLGAVSGTAIGYAKVFKNGAEVLDFTTVAGSIVLAPSEMVQVKVMIPSQPKPDVSPVVVEPFSVEVDDVWTEIA